MKKKAATGMHGDCGPKHLAIKDTMELLSGKWKIQIIGALMRNGTMRFMDLLREVDGIAAKMLSKELQELEINELVKRTVCDTKPITVEYEMTTYGRTLEKVIAELAHWGELHRKRIFKKSK
ncbi:MAG: transcriptional regulator [Chitinophagaceae bacterium]|nr:transcriptional regulator [Chitinophagaceae bacterium]